MDREEIQTRRREIEARFGPWISHNLQISDDLYTIHPGVAGGNESRLRRVVQLVSDLAHAPIEQLRVLDLGAFEGLFAVELARRGATVTAIEGREASLEKMRLAKDAWGLQNLELRLEDVRALHPEEHGEFDVVLCLGLLYHLDAPDIFRLLETMNQMCEDLAIIETRVAPEPEVARYHRGRPYWGRVTAEPPPDTPPLSRDALWSSIGNRQSFELTRPSLGNALADAGYSSVLECYLPPVLSEQEVRATIVAFARPRLPILSVPALNGQSWERLVEPPLRVHRVARGRSIYEWIRGLVPGRARRLARRIAARISR